MNALSQVVMSLVSEDTDHFGGQCFVEKFYNCFDVCRVTRGYCTLLDMFPGPTTNLHDIHQKRFLHDCQLNATGMPCLNRVMLTHLILFTLSLSAYGREINTNEVYI